MTEEEKKLKEIDEKIEELKKASGWTPFENYISFDDVIFMRELIKKLQNSK